MSNASVLNLNSVLLEAPAILTESYAQETAGAICQGIRNKNVSICTSGNRACTNAATDLQIR